MRNKQMIEKFKCKKCRKEIDGHNQYCHEGMCDDCFFDVYSSENEIVQLKISLKGTKPEIWRRVLIKEDITFYELHKIIQKVMGWKDCHLYEFLIGKMRISASIEDSDDVDGELIDSKEIYIGDFLDEGGDLDYVYDFGDSWKHKIIIEKFIKLEKGKKYPICIDGKRACPPEDCGGISGYEELLKIRKNKKHPRYKELIVDWLGEGFDPEKFDINKVN